MELIHNKFESCLNGFADTLHYLGFKHTKKSEAVSQVKNSIFLEKKNKKKEEVRFFAKEIKKTGCTISRSGNKKDRNKREKEIAKNFLKEQNEKRKEKVMYFSFVCYFFYFLFFFLFFFETFFLFFSKLFFSKSKKKKEKVMYFSVVFYFFIFCCFFPHFFSKLFSSFQNSFFLFFSQT